MLRAELDAACDSGMLGCMHSTIAGLWAVLCKELGKAASELGSGPSDLNLSAVESKPRTAGRGSVQLGTCTPPPEPMTLLRDAHRGPISWKGTRRQCQTTRPALNSDSPFLPGSPSRRPNSHNRGILRPGAHPHSHP